MKKVKVKICGLRTAEDIEAVCNARPDFAGFIFDSTRRRYIEPQKAKELIQKLPDTIVPVGVFVNESIDTVAEITRTCGLGMIQLHGNEDVEYIKCLRNALQEENAGCLSNVRIIKAFSIKSEEDIYKAAESTADLVLLDHGQGGTGDSFDWSLIKDIGRDFFLAGGISSENVRAAISLAAPFAVDVSSSLETDGRKDPRKISEFMDTVRNVSSNMSLQ